MFHEATAVSKQRRQDRRRLLSALLLASLLHGLLLSFLWNALTASPGEEKDITQEKAPQKIASRTLSRAEWDKNRSVRQAASSSSARPNQNRQLQPPKKADEPQKPPQKESRPDGRVVAVAPGNGEVPKDARFLSETNNRVDRETISRHRQKKFSQLAPRPSSAGQKAPPLQQPSKSSPEPNSATANAEFTSDAADKKPGTPGNGGTGQDERPPNPGEAPAPAENAVRQAAQKAEQPFPMPSFEGLSGVPLRFRRAANGAADGVSIPRTLPGPLAFMRLGTGPGGGTGEASSGMAGQGGSLSLMPSAAFMDKMAGAPASDLSDRDGVAEGEGTYLNTAQWKHAGYFNRIKQILSETWNPDEQIALNDPTHRAYLFKDRCTVVNVTLDAAGTVKKVGVSRSSGAAFLDKAAMDAFRRAGEFPNPPTALLNDRGEITLQWGFRIEIEKNILNIFRQSE